MTPRDDDTISAKAGGRRRSLKGGYDADQIQVLEGLEAVRKRPGMYIGSTGLTGLHHLIREVVDNSVDEAMAGSLHTHRRHACSPTAGAAWCDNGRGIPVDPMTAARRKASRRSRSCSPCCTPAASSAAAATRCPAACTASASRWSTPCRRGSSPRSTTAASTTSWSSSTAARPQGKIQQTGEAPNGRTGTTITFWPDPEIFKAEGIEFRATTVLERLQTYAFLNKDLEIRFKDERPGHTQAVTYRYAGGIVDYVKHLNATKDALFKKVASYEIKADDYEVEIAMQWNTGYHEGIHSFANGIETPEGGTHEEGFRKALTNVVNKYARARAFLKEKDDNLLGEDIREGLTAIVAVKLQDPQFEGPDQGQARHHRDALGGREDHQRQARRVARGASRPKPRRWSTRRRRRNEPAWRRRQAARRHPPQVRARRRGPAGQAHRLPHQERRRSRTVHRRGRLGRWFGRATAATRRTRRSCRFAANPSTSSGPASTRS